MLSCNIKVFKKRMIDTIAKCIRNSMKNIPLFRKHVFDQKKKQENRKEGKNGKSTHIQIKLILCIVPNFITGPIFNNVFEQSSCLCTIFMCRSLLDIHYCFSIAGFERPFPWKSIKRVRIGLGTNLYKIPSKRRKNSFPMISSA